MACSNSCRGVVPHCKRHRIFGLCVFQWHGSALQFLVLFHSSTTTQTLCPFSACLMAPGISAVRYICVLLIMPLHYTSSRCTWDMPPPTFFRISPRDTFSEKPDGSWLNDLLWAGHVPGAEYIIFPEKAATFHSCLLPLQFGSGAEPLQQSSRYSRLPSTHLCVGSCCRARQGTISAAQTDGRFWKAWTGN